MLGIFALGKCTEFGTADLVHLYTGHGHLQLLRNQTSRRRSTACANGWPRLQEGSAPDCQRIPLGSEGRTARAGMGIAISNVFDI